MERKPVYLLHPIRSSARKSRASFPGAACGPFWSAPARGADPSWFGSASRHTSYTRSTHSESHNAMPRTGPNETRIRQSSAIPWLNWRVASAWTMGRSGRTASLASRNFRICVSN